MAFRTAINMELIQNVKWLYFALVQLMSLIWFHTRHLGQFVHRNLMIFGDYYKQPRALLSQQRLLFVHYHHNNYRRTLKTVHIARDWVLPSF